MEVTVAGLIVFSAIAGVVVIGAYVNLAIDRRKNLRRKPAKGWKRISDSELSLETSRVQPGSPRNSKTRVLRGEVSRRKL